MTIRFSIITCTWNSERYLAATIASVLSQDYQNFEYIFVDGGSTDSTLTQIAAIKRPVRVLNDVRGGITRALNEGIKAATGDVVAHIHSDDYYLKSDVLSRVAHAFENSDCDWLIGRSVSDIDGQLVPEGYTPPPYSYSALLRGNFVPHAATFVRRGVFQRFGMFDERYRLAMDYEMWLRIGEVCTPISVSEPLAAFRRHVGSATQANRLASLNEDFKARFSYAPLSRYPEFVLRYAVRRFRLFAELNASERPK